jgi:hypothetical protein
VATQFEEMVVAPYPLDLEQFGPELRERDFHFADRRFVFTGGQRRQIRRRQRLAVEFAVGAQRQCIEMHEHAGTM